MGNVCSPCNTVSQSNMSYSESESVDSSWADAVNHGFIGECQLLTTVSDDGIIESPVNIAHQRAIHVAAANGNHELLQYLLVNHANIDAKAPLTGNTALHEACKADDTVAIAILLVYGADSTTRNSQHYLAQDLTTVNIQEEYFDNAVKRGRDRLGRIVFSVDGGSKWHALPVASRYGLSGFV